MTTKTQTFEEWLSQCPDEYQFYCRFIDVKSDVETVADVEGIDLTNEQLDNVIDRFINSDWSDNNNVIYQLIQDELEVPEWYKLWENIHPKCIMKSWKITSFVMANLQRFPTLLLTNPTLISTNKMTQIDPNLDFVKTIYAKKMIDNLSQTEKDNALYNSAIDTLESYTKEDLIEEMQLSFNEEEIEDIFNSKGDVIYGNYTV